MKSLMVALTCMMLSWAMQAQETSDTLIDVARERVRISEQRTHDDALFSREMAACYQRFAVFDCQQKVKRTRRVVADELRRQEVVLNDMERRANAAASLNRSKQRVVPEHLPQSEVK